jgi:Ca2+ insensitive EF hand
LKGLANLWRLLIQPYVTELDLRHSLIPDDLIEDLLHSMPKHTGPDLEVDRHLPKYDYIGFMAKMAGGDNAEKEDKKTSIGVIPNGGAAASSPKKEILRPPVQGVASPKKENLRSPPPLNGNGSPTKSSGVGEVRGS